MKLKQMLLFYKQLKDLEIENFLQHENTDLIKSIRTLKEHIKNKLLISFNESKPVIIDNYIVVWIDNDYHFYKKETLS